MKVPNATVYIGKLLSAVSERIAISYYAKIFQTPIRHEVPARELAMIENSVQEKLYVEAIDKNIMLYKHGESDRKVLLVHGWSGRGTQMAQISEALVTEGFMTVSFDGPAHGKSEGKITILSEFIDSIYAINKSYGPFNAAVGHSLGGIALLNGLSKDLRISALVTIGSGDIISEIVEGFLKNVGADIQLLPKFIKHFEKKYGLAMNDFSASRVAKNIDDPVLIIHDENDDEVPVKSAYNIANSLNKSELMITKNLGHRKILGNENVIKKTVSFIDNNII